MRNLFQGLNSTNITILIVSILLAMSMVSCQQKTLTHAERKDIVDAVYAHGYLTSEQEYIVTAKVEGYLDRVLIKEGDTVYQGMPLMLLSNESQSAQLTNAKAKYEDALDRLSENSPDIQQLHLQIEQAKLQESNDKANYERYANLIASKAVSQVDFERAKLQYESAKRNTEIYAQSLDDLLKSRSLNKKEAETQLIVQQESHQDYFLASEINGQVLQVLKQQGELVKRGEAVAQLGGGKIIIQLYIAEQDIRLIQLGQKVRVSLNTDPDNKYWAHISKIFPAFDSQEQSFLAEATFDSLPTSLYAQTQLQANIIIAERENVLLIPVSYLAEGNMVQLEDLSYKKIRTGINNGIWVEVLEGLSENDIIQFPQENLHEE